MSSSSEASVAHRALAASRASGAEWPFSSPPQSTASQTERPSAPSVGASRASTSPCLCRVAGKLRALLPLGSLGSLGQVSLGSLGQVSLVSLSRAVPGPLVSGTAEGTSRVSDVTAAGPDLAEALRRRKLVRFDAEFVGTPAPLLVPGTPAPFVGTSVPLLALDIGGTLVPFTLAPAPPMRTYAAATTPMPPRSKGSALDSSGITFFTSEPFQFFCT